MDLKDQLLQIADKASKLKDHLLTEEATKNALVLPFISALGYDIFNPLEVLPEMVSDIGTKKGEKIDFAILKDGEPIILIECKQVNHDLNLYDNQLLRYYHCTSAKFGILTNGIEYRFYTDLVTPNKMDDKPFLVLYLDNLKDATINEVKKFHKSYFDVDAVLSTASELKYLGELRSVLSRELTTPSQEFVKFIGKQVYDAPFTQRVQDQFSDLLSRTIKSYINDLISDRLKVALKNQQEEAQKQAEEAKQEEEQSEDEKVGIVTTEEELKVYGVLKAILAEIVSPERIQYKDTLSYFGVNIDGDARKTICQVYIRVRKNKFVIPAWHQEDGQHTWETYYFDTLDDIYQYKAVLIESAKRYL